MENVKERIAELLEKKFEDEPEYFLVDIKTSPGKKIQVFVDGDQGITIEKCVELSRYIEHYLDEEGIAGPDYVLEVSSPGMSNPLKVLRQYKRRIGQEVDVLLLDGQKKHGVLKEADKEKLLLEEQVSASGKKKKGQKIEAESKLTEIAFDEIKSTKVSFKFK